MLLYLCVLPAPKIGSPEKPHGSACAHNLAKDRSQTVLKKCSTWQPAWQLRSS